ncbi:hypothetical protein N836_34620 [Leptolyngbya sp. Heron Island J]|nr:hypothetical protein N836_34620 [Leptolyngbya sp. Heron Island J]
MTDAFVICASGELLLLNAQEISIALTNLTEVEAQAWVPGADSVICERLHSQGTLFLLRLSLHTL